MARMGLEIVSFNVQNVTDEGNVIENLGIDRVVSISKSAQISRAESERDIEVAKANATKQANDARIEAETAIAERNNELEIKKQELKRAADVKKAEADAAYEIQQQEQRKTIEITTADANIAKQEKEIELREKEIAVKEKTLDADIRKQAEAEKYATQQKADAQLYQRQKEAEAKQFEIQKQAEAKKSQAEADRFAKEQEAEAVKAQGFAEAESIKAKGVADAESIKAKGLAEAEAMEKKADAMAKYGKAAMTEMIIKVLPEMAGAIAKPLEAIDKVTIIDSGNGETGVGSFSSNVPSVLAKTIESVKETTGFDLTEVMKANTYDAKTTKNIMIVGVGGQGTLLASKMLGYVLLKQRYDVKVSEVHGMSQRGGSVVTYVRYGEKVYSPVIDKGEADVIISFEQLEAARWVEFLKKDGVIITNTQKMEPMPVITGAAEYPEGLIEQLTAAGAKVDAKDFLALAEEAGSSKAVNIALMGRFSTYFPDITDEQWQDAIEKNVPAKFLELNRKAFELGRNA